MRHILSKFSVFFAIFLLLPFGFANAQEQKDSSTAGQNVAPSVQADEHPPLVITFVPINKSGLTPQVTFGCSIPYPTATLTFATRFATWTGSISCTTAVGLYGTTAFFNYNTGVVLGWGNQFNVNSTSASSSGSYSGVPSGTYEVNFNVDITPPSGYTTTPGAGCSYINGGPAVHCTVGSGTFTQP